MDPDEQLITGIVHYARRSPFRQWKSKGFAFRAPTEAHPRILRSMAQFALEAVHGLHAEAYDMRFWIRTPNPTVTTFA